jgi:hypothetical protein
MSLTEKIRKMLFEDTWNKYGSEYMSHPLEQEQQPSTLQPELPIVASAQANVQLTDAAPPVDDDVYVPVNNKELSNAFAALALKVPDRFVENLYRQVRDAVQSIELMGDEQLADAPPPEQELDERLKRYASALAESYWGDVKTGSPRRDQSDDDEADWDDEDIPESEREPSVIQGKYLAQYWRERPGKDPAKFKGSGESTLVTSTGRLLQQVARPLFDVPKDQLSDAVEYLRLQFKVITDDFDMPIPKDGPRTFSGMYIKKLVPKLKEDQLGGNFLNTVVTDFKGRDKKWLTNLATAALEEVDSEKAAWAKLKTTLEKEAPKQAKLLDDL